MTWNRKQVPAKACAVCSLSPATLWGFVIAACLWAGGVAYALKINTDELKETRAELKANTAAIADLRVAIATRGKVAGQ